MAGQGMSKGIDGREDGQLSSGVACNCASVQLMWLKLDRSVFVACSSNTEMSYALAFLGPCTHEQLQT